ncbi:MAG: hypothetical protein QNI91_12605 [Arenicellales bacterium]|nr:hypothetical protein [Arenicellales bacterium]
MLNDDLGAAIDGLRKIVEGRLEQTEAPLEVWAATADYMIESAEEAGFSSEIPLFIRGLFERAINQGLGRHSIGELIKILRPAGT